MQSDPAGPFRRLIAFLSIGRGRPLLTTAVALAAVAAIAAAAAFIGVVRTFYYGHDIVPMLDGAWRFVNGQRPHTDYYSPWGPMPFILYGVGLMLAGNSVVGFGYALALAAFTLGLLTWLVCRKRMFPVTGILASAAIALLTAAPFPVGFRPTILSHAMSYNRLGYALVGIILIEAFTVVKDKTDGFLPGLIAGACCAIALFNKASFGAVGVTIIAVSLLVSRDRWRLVGIACGMAALALITFSYLQFHLSAMFADLTIAAAARRKGISGWGMRWAVFEALPSFLPLLAGAFLLAWDPWRNSRERATVRFASIIACVLVLFGGAALLLSNAQDSGFPLTTLFAIVIWNEALLRTMDRPSALPYYCAIVAFAAVSFLPGFTADAAGMTYGLIQRVKPIPAGVELFHPPHLSKLILMDIPADARDWELRSNGAAYVNYINDAVNLVQKNSQPSETVMTFDSHDPLAYALLRKPAEGGFIAMGIDNSYSDDSKPSPERLFGNVDIVMYPKKPSASDVHFSGLCRNYGSYLRLHFKPCAESGLWVLYRRSAASSPCSVPTDPPK